MSRSPRHLLLVALALAGLMGLSACGNKHDVVTEAETEGIYVDVGELKYQVQLSRQLNPADVEDRAYLEGLPEEERALPANEVWFAVFMRVQNESDEPQLTTSKYEIIDTGDLRYEPLELPETNPFAYQAQELPGKEIYPVEDSPAEQGPIQGSLLLFKLKLESLESRPLELEIKSPDEPEKHAVVKLDV